MKTIRKTIPWILIISLKFVTTVDAWTNHHHPTNNGHVVSLDLRKRRRTSDSSSTMLYERAGEQEWEEPSQSVELQRATFEQSLNPLDLFRNHWNHDELFDTTSSGNDSSYYEVSGRLISISILFFCLILDSVAVLNLISIYIIILFSSGSDQQCEIPDQFKMNDCSGMDVLAFLGIRRAAPLVDYKQRVDWE